MAVVLVVAATFVTPQPLPSHGPAHMTDPGSVASSQYGFVVAGFVLGFLALALTFYMNRPEPVVGAALLGVPAFDWERRLKLVEWEKDRSLGAAKGIAATASGFLVPIATVLLSKHPPKVSSLDAMGWICGIAGMLLVAVCLSQESARFARASL
jgi:hypothetical protein